MYPIFGPPGILTPHIDAPQLGFGLEKPFLTPRESDVRMSKTGAKYTMDRFRSKAQNELNPQIQSPPNATLSRQYFPTSYSVPCTENGPTVSPSMDMSVQPQCQTCLRLLGPHPGTYLNNQFPNGAISNVATTNQSGQALNTCGIQCGYPRNYETTSVSGWPQNVVTALSM